ncbi:unnamed protein product, partial [Phaeothamnion confervicola]
MPRTAGVGRCMPGLMRFAPWRHSFHWMAALFACAGQREEYLSLAAMFNGLRLAAALGPETLPAAVENGHHAICNCTHFRCAAVHRLVRERQGRSIFRLPCGHGCEHYASGGGGGSGGGGMTPSPAAAASPVGAGPAVTILLPFAPLVTPPSAAAPVPAAFEPQGQGEAMGRQLRQLQQRQQHGAAAQRQPQWPLQPPAQWYGGQQQQQ